MKDYLRFYNLKIRKTPQGSDPAFFPRNSITFLVRSHYRLLTRILSVNDI